MREFPTTETDTSPRPPSSDTVLSRRSLLKLGIASVLVPGLSSCAQREATMGVLTAPAIEEEQEPRMNLAALEGQDTIIGTPFHLQVHKDGACVWEGDATFTSPTTLRIGEHTFACESITTGDGITINVEEAKGMLTNMGVRAEGGVQLHADLGSITLDEQSVARAGHCLDTSPPEETEVWVRDISCKIVHPLSLRPMERTVSGRFRRMDE